MYCAFLLFSKEISKELGLDLDFNKDTKTVRLTLDYDGKMANAGVYIELDSEDFLDLIAKKIPGKLDDAVIGLIKGAL